MKTLRKALAVLLTFAMLTSLIVVPASAANATGDSTISLSLNVQAGEWSYGEGTNTYTVEVIATASTGNVIPLNGLQLILGYDKDALTYANPISTGIATDYYGESGTGRITGVANATKGYVKATYTNSDPDLVAQATSGSAIATFKFKVASADVESGNVEFSLLDTDGGNFLTYVDGDTKQYTMSIGDDVSATIKGALPTVGSVSLPASSVQVEGNDAEDQTIQATATSTSGKNITNYVTWSVVPSGNGVIVDPSSGLISIDGNAEEGSYTIKADAKSGFSQGTTVQTALTVTRAPSVVQAVLRLEGYDGANIRVNQVFKFDEAYTAVVEDQFGQSVLGGTDVDWDISPANEGVTIDEEGYVTLGLDIIDYVKKEHVMASPKVYTITGTVNGKSATHTLNLFRDPVLTSLEICGPDGNPVADNIVIPIMAEDQVRTFSAKLFDQFGEEMDGEVTWMHSSSMNPLPTGTTLSGDLKTVTVAGNANPTDENVGWLTLYVMATVNGVPKHDEIKIAVAKLNPVWDSVGVPTTIPVYGTKNADIFTLPTTGTLQYYLANPNEKQTLTGTYSVVDPDVIQNCGARTATVKFTASNDDGNGDYKGIELTYTVELIISRKYISVSGITVSDKVYDGTTNAVVNTSGAQFNGIVAGDTLTVSTTGTFADKNVGSNKTVNLGALTLGGEKASNYGLRDDCQKTATASITPKTLTFNAGHLVVSKVYDGTTSLAWSNISGNFGFSGVIDGEGGDGLLYVSYQPGAFADANAGTNKSATFTNLEIAGTQSGNYVLDRTEYTLTTATITPKSIEAEDVVVAPIDAQPFKNAQITPDVTVTYAGMTLDGDDYTVEYGANKDCVADSAQDGSVTITGKGNYTGTKTVYFDIIPTTTTLTIKSTYGSGFVYNNAPIAVPTPSEIECNISGADVTYTYYSDAAGENEISAPSNAGTYYVKGYVAADTNYTAATSPLKEFTINQRNISNADIADIAAQIYSGAALVPGISVTDFSGSKILTGDDFSVEITNNENVGTATVTITGKGNYTGTKSATFEIVPATIIPTVTVATGSTYNGNAQTPDVTVINGEIELVLNKDYTLSYDNNIAAGEDTAKVTVIAKNGSNYTFSHVPATFSIAKKTISANEGDLVITKEYDGTTDAGAKKSGALDLTGVVSGDDISVAYTAIGAYASANYGTGINVTLTGLTLSGDDADNYALSDTSGEFAVGEITKTLPKLADFSYTITSPVTYDGQTHPVSVTTDKTGMGSFTVLYNGQTTAPKAADTYEVTLQIAEGSNYAATTLDLGELVINPKSLGSDTSYTSGITVDDIAAVVYKGAAWEIAPSVKDSGTTLVAGTDYTVSYANNTNAGTATITITGKDNFSGEITKAFTINKAALTITAADQTIDYGSELNLENVQLTYRGFVDGENETVLGGEPALSSTYTNNSPVNGTYKVNVAKGTISNTNYEITYVPGNITVTAKNLASKDIVITVTSDHVYNATAHTPTYTVKNGIKTLTNDTDFTAEVTNNTNAGTATITLTGKGNYTGTKTVSFTIAQKTATLTWSSAENATLYYNGQAQSVTATISNLESADEGKVTVTVVGGIQTAIGSYTAKATAITGEKAANYKLPEIGLSLKYNIVAALENVTVAPETVTATIDGLTIKLVGYVSDLDDLKINGTAIPESKKMTFNTVEYIIDNSGVEVLAANVTVSDSVTPVEPSTEAVGAGVTDAVTSALSSAATKVEGLRESVAKLIADVSHTDKHPEGTASVEIEVSLHIEPLAFGDGKLKLDVDPQITVIFKDNGGNAIGEVKTTAVANNAIKAPITISVKLPVGMPTTNLFAKHALSGGKFEYLPVTVVDGVATWNQSSFSEVELISDVRTATVTYEFDNGSTQTITYTATGLNTALPTDSCSGYRFSGWKFKSSGTEVDSNTYSTLTDALLTTLSGQPSLTAEPQFTTISHGGAAISTFVIKASASEGGTISPSGSVKVSAGSDQTFTFTPNAGYRVKEVIVDGKAVTAASSYTFKNVEEKHTIAVTFEKGAVTNPFTDVSSNTYYYDAVLWAVENGITSGITETTFVPSATCNRGQMVTFLWRAAGMPEPASTANPFTDVNESAYYYKAVLWAVERGITNGTTDTTFSPASPCNRGQMATFLWRAEGKKAPANTKNIFTDVAAGKYYYEAVLWAAERGITTGKTPSIFAPGEACNRGQMVTFLYRNELAD